jgi:hypothetical protein
VGIFIRGAIPWDEDPEVDNNVVVCAFMPQASGTMSVYRPCTVGYRLHCSDGNFQLYNKNRAQTFIFMTRPPRERGYDVIASIALEKISGRVQKASSVSNFANLLRVLSSFVATWPIEPIAGGCDGDSCHIEQR